MYKVHKVRLDPNNVQATGLSRATGVARFAYNWGLEQWSKQYDEFKKGERDARPTQLSLRRELNSIKRDQFPWMLESTKCAPQEALINLGRAFDRFFKNQGCYPKFKKRGAHDSFKLSSGQFSVVTVDGTPRLRVPRVGEVRMSEIPRFDGDPVSATVSQRAGMWFVPLMFRVEDVEPATRDDGTVVGVDFGVGELVRSDGVGYQVPREYRRRERKLRRAQQELSRRKKGSANRAKAVARVSRLHYRTACVRENWQHHVTADLISTFSTIVIEDLNVAGMKKNRSLAKSVSDVGFGEIRRQIEYKAAQSGVEVVIADRWFPSSKTCNLCGTRTKSLPLHIREWDCEHCGAHHDRDLNAAINLENLAVSSTVTACGEFLSSDEDRLAGSRQDASVKQESDSASA